MKYDAKEAPGQGRTLSQDITTRLEAYVSPLLSQLTTLLDKRLVRTLLGLIAVIISFRGYRHGLLLSELGACCCSIKLRITRAATRQGRRKR